VIVKIKRETKIFEIIFSEKLQVSKVFLGKKLRESQERDIDEKFLSQNCSL